MRDYGVAGQLGLEKTFEEYIDKLCDIYDEVKRVLRKDGCIFVNLGDTYYSNSAGTGGPSDKQDSNAGSRFEQRRYNIDYPAKSLCLIPDRFRIEMLNRGWIIRNKIIWHKPNPMPSSAKDRFTVDFEDVIFMTKSNTASYYVHPRKMRSSSTKKFDYIWAHRNTGLEVNYQPFSDRLCKGKKRLWNRRNLWEGRDYWFEPQYEPHSRDWTNCGGNIAGSGLHKRNNGYSNPKDSHPKEVVPNPLGRNKRCVWTISTQAYKEAHFATFPEKLVEPMILAGCPEFVCTKCGKAREKVYEPSPEYAQKLKKSQSKGGIYTYVKNGDGFNFGGKQANESVNPERYFIGYTDCGCNAEWRPGIVLDMFRRFGDDFEGSRPVAA